MISQTPIMGRNRPAKFVSRKVPESSGGAIEARFGARPSLLRTRSNGSHDLNLVNFGTAFCARLLGDSCSGARLRNGVVALGEGV